MRKEAGDKSVGLLILLTLIGAALAFLARFGATVGR